MSPENYNFRALLRANPIGNAGAFDDYNLTTALSAKRTRWLTHSLTRQIPININNCDPDNDAQQVLKITKITAFAKVHINLSVPLNANAHPPHRSELRPTIISHDATMLTIKLPHRGRQPHLPLQPPRDLRDKEQPTR